MGQRLTAKSTFELSESQHQTPSIDETELSLNYQSLTPPTSKRFVSVSGIPTRRAHFSVKKMNSTSSTATTASVSSPDRSLTASPTKSRSSVSMNNNSRNGGGHDDLNGNLNSASSGSSPNKSRIPVLRSPSYKVPRNVCFGHGSKKAFDMKHWYQTIARSTRTVSMEEANFERDMKMALD